MPTTPIFCPCCRSLRVEFVTEYHQALGLRFLRKVLRFFLYAFLIFFVLNLLPLASFNEELIKAVMKEESFSLLMIVLLAIGSSICSLMIFLTESKTHIKAICRDCGNLWNLN